MQSTKEAFNWQEAIEKLQRSQKASNDARGVQLAEPEVSQETLAKQRRAARLKAAGEMFPAAVEAAMESAGRCPRIDGHAASEKIARAVEEFVRSRDLYSLVLIAPAGRGKSFAATWAVAEWTRPAMWLPADECRVGSSWDALRENATKATLLVIDDLGEEAGNEWGAREMASLMQNRHNKGARTIVTTNLAPSEIAARYGERLVSRWSEAPYSRVVGASGEDLRKMGGSK